MLRRTVWSLEDIEHCFKPELIIAANSGHYGIRDNDPRKGPASEYRVDLCISVEWDVAVNSFGVINKTISAVRCAKVRHYGSRENVTAAYYLYEEWLPKSEE